MEDKQQVIAGIGRLMMRLENRWLRVARFGARARTVIEPTTAAKPRSHAVDAPSRAERLKHELMRRIEKLEDSLLDL